MRCRKTLQFLLLLIGIANGHRAYGSCTLDYQVLRSFGNTNHLGIYPGRLIEGSDGKLYGTTTEGGYGGIGMSSTGVVYVIHHDGSGYQVLHHFVGGTNDGATPNALLEGSDGLLYGTTTQGGSNGGGTLFKLSKTGTGYTAVCNFTNLAGQLSAPRGLIQATNGALCGWAELSGQGSNVLFRIHPDGTGFAIVRAFSLSSEGRGMALLQASDGQLYGILATGSGGSAFRISADGTGYTVLHPESAWSDFDELYLREGSDGILYGTAMFGANFTGSLFKLNRDGSGYAELFDFADSAGGQAPTDLIEGADGKLYGTTSSAGTNSYGVVFQVNRNGSGYTALWHLDSNGPQWPVALVQSSDGKLYSAARFGGFGLRGALFTVSTNGTSYALLWEFSETGGSQGFFPAPAVIRASDDKLYGATPNGGVFGYGTVYRMNTDGSGYEVLRSFGGTGVDSKSPRAGLLEASDQVLYGITSHGGLSDEGTVFKINRDGSGFAVLHSFDQLPDGRTPAGRLIEGTNGVLYGIAEFGGANNRGTIFRIDRDGTAFTRLHDFTSADQPSDSTGLLLGSDGVIYGTATGGLFGTGGAVFRIHHDGSGYAVLRSFGSPLAQGSEPVGALVEISNVLYGATFAGGSSNLGTVFRMSRDGSGHQVLGHLGGTATDATSPLAGLVVGPCGLLYGTAAAGGAHNKGAIFGLKTDGSDYAVVHHFNAANGDGRSPRASLFAGTNGSLYGTTRNGGWLDIGTVFKLAVPDDSCPTNLVVTTTNDSGPGSLRETITQANLGCAPGPVLISFNIPGAGVHTIAPLTSLPTVTRAVIIDGYTQPGSSPNSLVQADNAQLRVELSGASLASPAYGLWITGNGCTVRGLVINRFAPATAGLLFENSDGHVVEGCFIGTDATGTNALPNDSGILVLSSGIRIGGLVPAARNVIGGNTVGINVGTSTGILVQGNFIGIGADGMTALTASPQGWGLFLQNCFQMQIGGAGGARNVISGSSIGCWFSGGASNLVEGNFIGTDASGTLRRGNNVGVVLNESSHNLVGGTNAGQGNLCSGNISIGVQLAGAGASNNLVVGNFVGTDVTGTNALSNETGIVIGGGIDNRIGGFTPAARNIISGNSAAGILVQSLGGTNEIVGNYIGLGVDGQTAVANVQGVYLYSASHVQVGGTAAGAGNVLSGNTNGGYVLNGGTNVFQGNFIGTDASGVFARPNFVGVVLTDSTRNLVGGSAPGAGNVIGFNRYAGVALTGDSATNNAVLGNRIFAHTWGGIDLGLDEASANDPADPDPGPNRFQNFPEIAAARLDAGNLSVRYRVDSIGGNSAYPLTVELFLADPSGDGQTLLQRHTYDTPQTFTNFTFTPLVVVSVGNPIVATATDANGNTSEFSTMTTVTICSNITIAPFVLPNAARNSAYTNTLVASGGVAPYTFAVTSGTLPAGITLSSAGILSGISTSNGTNVFTVTATDAGGCPGTNDYSLITESSLFKLTEALNHSRVGHTATLLPNGKVLVAGGQNSVGILASVEIFDPVTGQWAAGSPMSGGRVFHSAVLLTNGEVLVFGGVGIGQNSAERYHPATDTWSPTGSMSERRYVASGTRLSDGRVLAAGGFNNEVGTTDSAELYDPATGQWTNTGSMTGKRAAHEAVLLAGGKVLAICGQNNTGSPFFPDTSELYDPVTGQWTPTGSLSVFHLGSGVALLADGRVFVAGGDAGVPAGMTDRAEIYNPATGVWSLTSPLPSPQSGHGVASLLNGKVLVAGGYDATNTLRRANLFDPLTGSWVTAGTLHHARFNATATRLLDGRVLFVGGFNNDFLSSAELYDPDNIVLVGALSDPALLPGGGFRFTFTGTPVTTFTVLTSTNVGLSLDQWTVLGSATEVSPGHYQFTDLQASNQVLRFYRVRSP